jgi:hypothetical protein
MRVSDLRQRKHFAATFVVRCRCPPGRRTVGLCDRFRHDAVIRVDGTHQKVDCRIGSHLRIQLAHQRGICLVVLDQDIDSNSLISDVNNLVG